MKIYSVKIEKIQPFNAYSNARVYHLLINGVTVYSSNTECNLNDLKRLYRIQFKLNNFRPKLAVFDGLIIIIYTAVLKNFLKNLTPLND